MKLKAISIRHNYVVVLQRSKKSHFRGVSKEKIEANWKFQFSIFAMIAKKLCDYF